MKHEETTVGLSQKIRELYRITKELEEQFPGRKFTPDGHFVGSIGEVLAAGYYGLALLPNSSETHDAIDTEGFPPDEYHMASRSSDPGKVLKEDE